MEVTWGIRANHYEQASVYVAPDSFADPAGFQHELTNVSSGSQDPWAASSGGWINAGSINNQGAGGLSNLVLPELFSPFRYLLVMDTTQVSSGRDGFDIDAVGVTPAPVPEPATLILLGTGLIGLAGFRRKRLRK